MPPLVSKFMADENSVMAPVRVGIIGCGEIVQVAHIPTLNLLSNLFKITYLCDVSNDALAHCAQKVIGKPPLTTRDPKELCSSPDVDVVLIANADAYHAVHAILGLQHNKVVFVEKPLALNKRDADAIIEAERRSTGKIMVGYMRRYAPAFEDAIQELGGIEKVTYARVRDIIGPNSAFVNQSGTFPKKFSDFRKSDTEDMAKRTTEIIEEGLTYDCNVPVTEENVLMLKLLGGLGSHDLSVMREALGMPQKVIGASLGFPFWNVLFQYPGFVVNYESGIDNIPRFDAHLEIYSTNKSIRVQYDTPYVKGLPVTMHICEGKDGAYVETTIRKTYEDLYTIEFKKLYELAKNGRPVKTTAQDARRDLEIFEMIMRAGNRNETRHGVNGTGQHDLNGTIKQEPNGWTVPDFKNRLIRSVS